MSHIRILQPGDLVKVSTGVHASRRGTVIERVRNPRSGDELVIEETPRPPATQGPRFCVQATKCEMAKDKAVVPAGISGYADYSCGKTAGFVPKLWSIKLARAFYAKTVFEDVDL